VTQGRRRSEEGRKDTHINLKYNIVYKYI